MIDKPKVGMRVRINESFGGRYREGDTGEIIRVDGDNMPLVAVDGRNKVCITDSKLTEIKENDMEKGDLVTVSSTKGSICLTQVKTHSRIMSDEGEFEVVRFVVGDIMDSNGMAVHDIVLRNVCTDNLWLHSRQYVNSPKPKVKEVTAEQMMRDLKEKYGCEVKVTE